MFRCRPQGLGSSIGGLTMRHARVLFALLIACALLVSWLPMSGGSSAGAQESGAGNGDAVPVTDEEGAAVGSITVSNVVDPFTELDPAYPADEGARYVA